MDRKAQHFKTMKHAVALAATMMLALLMVLCAAVSVSADSREFDGECRFRNNKIVSDFSSAQVAREFEDLQPGDDLTFTVDYINSSDDSTDWYMENSVLQTLEKTDAAKKIAGTGQAAGGGYTYRLTLTSADGSTRTLFSNERVGGEAKPRGMEGLEQATNALEDWFYLETLKAGESGSVSLFVRFEGETEVNDYMDTEGELNLRFAVELTPEGGGGGDTPGTLIKTGDNSRLLAWSAVLIASSVILALAALLTGSRRRTESRETGGAE